jgi:RNA-directed DNA polymerase
MTTQLETIRKYGMTERLDQIYANSKNGDNAKRLYSDIISEPNLLMAIDNIKTNNGATTPGVDGKTIDWYIKQPTDILLQRLKDRLNDYKPQPIIRVYIDKDNGDKRPLGIPTIEDRILQQAIKQILEPWCEARFHPHSYGFRPLRSAHHALSRTVTLVNVAKMYYTVDIDLKGFFDNVPHNKLNKALWNIGIQDKRVLSIIDKMLKSEVVSEGILNKGVPQGGVLSPLLSNIILNQLDWWVSTQWEDLPVKDKRYVHRKKTNLKSGFIVRYADDFKIMCRSYEHAIRWYHAVTQWLTKYLGLPINEEKSGVTNLKRKATEFLGFTIKARPKGTSRYGFVAETHITNKNKKRIQQDLRNAIKHIQYNSYSNKTSIQYNLKVMGIKRYFQYATHVYLDLDEVAQSTYRTMKVRLRDRRHQVLFKTLDQGYKKHHPGVKANTKISVVAGTPLHLIQAVHHKNPMNFTQSQTLYSKTGREQLNKPIALPLEWIQELVNKSNYTKSTVEFINNRMSRYIADDGKCYVTGQTLRPNELHCHHKKPRKYGGTDEYRNLCLVHKTVHKLIHGTTPELIAQWLDELRISSSQLKKINHLRQLAGNDPIVI